MKMNGIKLSQHCAHLVETTARGTNASPLVAALSSARVNIQLLNLDAAINQEEYFSCCIDQEDTAKAVLASLKPGHTVQTISVYPHKNRLKILGLLVKLMITDKINFSDLVTTGSMLTFVVAQEKGAPVCDYLARHVELPVSRTPFEQFTNQEDLEFLKKWRQETCATYVEEKIKTYGIGIVPNLDLYTLDTGPDDLVMAAQFLETLEDKTELFHYSSAHMRPGGRLYWHFTVDSSNPAIRRHLISGLTQSRASSLNISTAMAGIFFQGPHFGDRYGIAQQAINILKQADVPVHLAGFTGSSISIIVPDHLAMLAKQALSKVFIEP